MSPELREIAAAFDRRQGVREGPAVARLSVSGFDIEREHEGRTQEQRTGAA